MKPKEVRKLLNCSYTSLNNWIKSGKLKYSAISGKRHDYDDESVYQLYDEICGRRKLNDRIDIFLKNQKYEFVLDREMINDVLDFINEKMKTK